MSTPETGAWGGDPDMVSGRDALARLDLAVENARTDFDHAVIAADGHAKRRADLVRLRAESYRELAKIRLDLIREGSLAHLSAAEAQAQKLVADHKTFL